MGSPGSPNILLQLCGYFSNFYLVLILYNTANNEAPPSEEALRDQEVKIMELGEQFKGEGKTQEMTDLIQKVRTILKFMSKAKAAKLVHIYTKFK